MNNEYDWHEQDDDRDHDLAGMIPEEVLAQEKPITPAPTTPLSDAVNTNKAQADKPQAQVQQVQSSSKKTEKILPFTMYADRKTIEEFFDKKQQNGEYITALTKPTEANMKAYLAFKELLQSQQEQGILYAGVEALDEEGAYKYKEFVNQVLQSDAEKIGLNYKYFSYSKLQYGEQVEQMSNSLGSVASKDNQADLENDSEANQADTDDSMSAEKTKKPAVEKECVANEYKQDLYEKFDEVEKNQKRQPISGSEMFVLALINAAKALPRLNITGVIDRAKQIDCKGIYEGLKMKFESIFENNPDVREEFKKDAYEYARITQDKFFGKNKLTELDIADFDTKNTLQEQMTDEQLERANKKTVAVLNAIDAECDEGMDQHKRNDLLKEYLGVGEETKLPLEIMDMPLEVQNEALVRKITIDNQREVINEDLKNSPAQQLEDSYDYHPSAWQDLTKEQRDELDYVKALNRVSKVAESKAKAPEVKVDNDLFMADLQMVATHHEAFTQKLDAAIAANPADSDEYKLASKRKAQQKEALDMNMPINADNEVGAENNMSIGEMLSKIMDKFKSKDASNDITQTQSHTASM